MGLKEHAGLARHGASPDPKVFSRLAMEDLGPACERLTSKTWAMPTCPQPRPTNGGKSLAANGLTKDMRSKGSPLQASASVQVQWALWLGWSFHCPHRADNLAALAGINILRILEEASGPLTPSCAQSPLKAQPVLASRIEVRRAVDEGRTRKLHTFMLFRDQRTGLHVGG